MTKQSESTGAVECTQDTALQASSTADFELFVSPMNCRYKANSCGLAGIGERLYPVAQLFHLLKAPRYFLTVLLAWLWRIVVVVC